MGCQKSLFFNDIFEATQGRFRPLRLSCRWESEFLKVDKVSDVKDCLVGAVCRFSDLREQIKRETRKKNTISHQKTKKQPKISEISLQYAVLGIFGETLETYTGRISEKRSMSRKFLIFWPYIGYCKFCSPVRRKHLNMNTLGFNKNRTH